MIRRFTGLFLFVLFYCFCSLRAEMWRKDLLRECTSLWTFTEGGGTTVRNHILGRPNLVITNGGVWVETRDGFAVELDGSNDLMTTQIADFNPGTGGYTISMWLKISRNLNHDVGYAMIDKRQDSSNVMEIFFSPPANNFQVTFRGGGFSNNVTFVPSTWTAFIGNEMNLTMTRAATNAGVYTLYINNEKIPDGGAAPITVTANINTNVSINFGANQSATQALPSTIKAVGIWNRELSRGEVGVLYDYFRSNVSASSD